MAMRDSGESVFVWTDAAGDFASDPDDFQAPSASWASGSPPTALRPARSSRSTPAPRASSGQPAAITLTADGFLVVWSSSASPGAAAP